MIADMKSWKDRVREGSLQRVPQQGRVSAGAFSARRYRAKLQRLAGQEGYKFRTRETDSGAR